MPAEQARSSEARGDIAARAFRQYARVLQRYLARLTRAGADIPDLSGEVYERFLRVKDIEAVREPRAILFRIARFVVTESLRMQSTHAITFDSEAMTKAGDRLEVAHHDAVDQQTDAERELRRVREAMKKLPPMQQAVLWLAVHDGLSYSEISKRTGLTINTITMYVCEARARLRALVDRHQG